MNITEENKGDHFFKKIQWLHLSDLHIFCSSDLNVMKNRFSLLANKINPSFIVVTGDFRHYIKQKSFQYAKQYLENVAMILGISKKDIYFVPGNHDVNTENTLAGREHARLSNILEEVNNGYDINQDDILYLQEAQKEYIEFVREFYGNEISSNDPRLEHPLDVFLFTRKNDGLNIVTLNTALMSCNNEFGENNEVIDMYRLSCLKNEYDYPSIVIGHHPISNLACGVQNKLTELFKSLNVSAYLCGDLHKVNGNLMNPNSFSLNIPCIVCGKSSIEQGDKWSDVNVISYTWDGNDVEVIVYRYEKGGGNKGAGFYDLKDFYKNPDTPYSFPMNSSIHKNTEMIQPNERWSYRVLITDDNIEAREILRQALNNEFYNENRYRVHVEDVMTASEARAKASENHYDVYILDVAIADTLKTRLSIYQPYGVSLVEAILSDTPNREVKQRFIIYSRLSREDSLKEFDTESIKSSEKFYSVEFYSKIDFSPFAVAKQIKEYFNQDYKTKHSLYE